MTATKPLTMEQIFDKEVDDLKDEDYDSNRPILKLLKKLVQNYDKNHKLKPRLSTYQEQILAFRDKGYTQEKIAELTNTAQPNVSVALQNIKKKL